MENNTIGRFEDITFESIECSSVVFKRLVWKEHRYKTIAVIFFSALFFFSGFFFFLIIPFAYFFYFLHKAREGFLKEFAQKNNLEYKSSIPVNELTGRLFKVGHSRVANNVIIGSYNNQKARLFYYKYTIGSGKHSKTYEFTVFELFFEEINFPYMLLQSRTMRRFGSRGSREIKVSLEQEFRDNYNLFIRDGYGIEAMQIFSEDFLRLLKKESSNFSIEIKKGRVYIYDDTLVIKKKDLKELYEVVEKIVINITPLLSRVKKDFQTLNPYFNK